MGTWDSITEARIKEWQERRAEESGADEKANTPVFETVESQLFDEIVAARAAAREVDDPAERNALLTRAKRTRVRLMVLLEKGGFPLLARSLQQRLDEAVRDSRS
ncbi:MAG: hypothetical protein ACQEVA_15760 [Myxococcota bacterium]